MSEITRTLPSPAELRTQGFRLLQACWLPILTGALLAVLPTLLGDLVLHLSPADPTTLEDLAAMMSGRPYTVPALIASIVIELGGLLLFSPAVLLGLYKGLLGHLRGERCTLACLVSGFSRWKTAVALEFLTGMRILGYLILGSIGQYLLGFIPVLGGIVGGIGYIVLVWWATWRYALSDCHLADDAEPTCTASDCLDYSIADVKLFSITGLIEVIWPSLLPSFVSNLLTRFLPVSLELTLATCALQMAVYAFTITGCTAVYAGLRSMHPAAEEEPVSDGLARARALAASVEYTED